jgi:uncharacterized DUF497 family protein
MLEFDWDEANIAHIARHNVTPTEAEQVILNNPLDLGSRIRSGELRSTQLGITNAGRILLVIIMWRGTRLRVVTSYPAGRKSRQLYLGEDDDAHL